MKNTTKSELLDHIESLCSDLYTKVKSGFEYESINSADGILTTYIKISDEYPEIENDISVIILNRLAHISNLKLSRDSDDLFNRINYVINFIEGIG